MRSRSVRTREGEKLYDLLAPAYDLLAPPSRVGAEIDALEPRLRAAGARRILDAGCAVGTHAIELARRGFEVLGFDRSKVMIREAKRRASSERIAIRFFSHDLTAAGPISGHPYDAALCLGNTISSVSSPRDRDRTLRSFHRSLRPGGLLVIQMRDLTSIRRTGHVFPVKSLRRGAEEWILLRRHDPVREGIRFVSTLLHRPGPEAGWEAAVSESVLEVHRPAVWRTALRKAGFLRIDLASDLHGTPRREKAGNDLVLFAHKP